MVHAPSYPPSVQGPELLSQREQVRPTLTVLSISSLQVHFPLQTTLLLLKY